MPVKRSGRSRFPRNSEASRPARTRRGSRTTRDETEDELYEDLPIGTGGQREAAEEPASTVVNDD